MGKLTQPEEPVRRLIPRGFPLTGDLGPGELDLPRALLALRDRPGLVAMDSAGGKPARWSLVAFDPFDDFGQDTASAPRSLEELEDRLSAFELTPGAQESCDALPFAGGFIGALAYELGAYGEKLELPPPVWPVPPIVGGLYGDWILFEHGPSPRTTLYLSEGAGGAPGPASILERYASVVDDLRVGAPAALPIRSGGLRRPTSTDEHKARVEGARAKIAEGEIYQANVAHRMVAETAAQDVDLFLELRRVNAAPYMGFCRFSFDGDERAGAILSASPELLLELGPDGGGGGRVARTRPIKGTIGRGQTPRDDEAAREKLLASKKDRAELAMIVDLERNDLGRIAEPGGVEVKGFPSIETYASVHHLVADVVARVRPGASALDVVASLFPGGSITGAPKLRSMEVIADLEGEGRGFFTGSLGFVDLRGRVLLNILIRTLIFAAREPEDGGGASVSFHVGGGITWSSVAADEDQETLLKAEGLLRGLGVSGSEPMGRAESPCG